jgi:serine/threonine-protein kinase HipA
MNVRALEIFLGSTAVGLLFQYGERTGHPTLRFVAHDAFAARADPPTLSLSMLADQPEAQRALWANIAAPVFNGSFSPRNGDLLPAFFQGLLPEGVFRDHIAALRGCQPNDHFEMLAACGADLPGNVYARPVELSRDMLTHLVTQDADALEMSVTAQAMEAGVSVSGVQPKVGAIRDGDRYVGRTKLQSTHIIAKLPVVGWPLLPELEDVSLRLARAAGVTVCQARLEPLAKLAMAHGYDLGEADARTQFLAVERFDRSPARRYHVEDFAQIMGVAPERKYDSSYLEVAAVMLGEPGLGEAAVHELLRRMVVNEMLGNQDMHLKNMGVIYRDDVTPSLSPAYDVVGYGAFGARHGHALFIVPPAPEVRAPTGAKARAQLAHGVGDAAEDKPRLTPHVVREFCARLGMLERPAAAAIQKAVADAAHTWPGLIAQSALSERQKAGLLNQFDTHALVVSWRKRRKPGGGAATLA